MNNFSLFSIGEHFGKTKDIPRLINGFNLYERIAFWLFFWIALISIIILIALISNKFLVTIPVNGGSFTEGIIGRPGFINPVLAISDTDKDISMLVYSGLMRNTPNGDLVKDLAKEITINKAGSSNSGTTYTVTLKDGLSWQDGEPLTTDDVLFTIQKIQDPLINSPLRASWDGVVVDVIDRETISFTLNEPYALFLNNLTIGLIPKHIWKNFGIEDFNNNIYNTKPIGSGPYKIESIKRDREALIVGYKLSSFPSFALGMPYISTIELKFYNNKDVAFNAYKNGNIDSIGGLDPEKIEGIDKKYVYPFPLTRIFAVFLNQSEAQIFTDKEVRKALFYGIDRKKIIDEILLGYGTPIIGPFPKGATGYKDEKISKTKTDAKKILTDNGWSLNENGIYEKNNVQLTFTLSTASVDEFKKIAELLKKEWREIGILVKLKFFESGDLKYEVIRPRKYEALLFGEVSGVDPDPFAFWHSSQRLDPGLNIALYANISADKLLDSARVSMNKIDRTNQYEKFAKEVEKDIPSIFLYSPDYIYLAPKQLKNTNSFSITTGSDRFINIYEQYIKTDKVWKIFL